jgi:hypothetical protein
MSEAANWHDERAKDLENNWPEESKIHAATAALIRAAKGCHLTNCIIPRKGIGGQAMGRCDCGSKISKALAELEEAEGNE